MTGHRQGCWTGEPGHPALLRQDQSVHERQCKRCTGNNCVVPPLSTLTALPFPRTPFPSLSPSRYPSLCHTLHFGPLTPLNCQDTDDLQSSPMGSCRSGSTNASPRINAYLLSLHLVTSPTTPLNLTLSHSPSHSAFPLPLTLAPTRSTPDVKTLKALPLALARGSHACQPASPRPQILPALCLELTLVLGFEQTQERPPGEEEGATQCRATHCSAVPMPAGLGGLPVVCMGGRCLYERRCVYGGRFMSVRNDV